MPYFTLSRYGVLTAKTKGDVILEITGSTTYGIFHQKEIRTIELLALFLPEEFPYTAERLWLDSLAYDKESAQRSITI